MSKSFFPGKVKELAKARVIKNFIALGLVQATNYIIPLITIPYVIRVVGTERFGLIAFAQSIFIFLVVFTDYGFNLTATKALSLERENKERVSAIFSNTFFTKLLLCLLSFLLLTGLVFSIEELRNEYFFYLISFSLVVGQALLPTWFFQGIEQMRYITILNLIAKIVLAALIFIVVSAPDDYVYVLPIFAAGNVVSAIIGLWLIFRKFNIQFRAPSSSAIKEQLQEGWHIFLSNLGVSVYMHSSIIVLGFFATNQTVGYYSVADKIVLTIRSLLAVYYQAIYPQVCVIAKSGIDQLKAFFKKFFLPFAAVIFLGCSLLFIISDEIIYLFSGEYSDEMTLLLRILSFVPFVVVINIPFNQTLLAYNHKKEYLQLIGLGSLVSLLLLITLTYVFGATGTAVGVLLTEVLITAGFVFLARKLKKRIW